MLEPSAIESLRAADPLGFLLAQLERHAGTGGLLQVVLPAPVASPDLWLRAMGGAEQVLWQPPTGPVWAGTGIAARVVGAGHDRYEHVRERAHSVWTTLQTIAHPDAPPVTPRFLGGLAFTPGGAAREPWSRFGDAHFVIPRIAYVQSEGRGALLVTASEAERQTADSRRPLGDDARTALAQLRADSTLGTSTQGQPLSYRPGRPSAVDEMSRQEWAALVGGIRDQIRAGRFDKIVLSRRTRLAFDREVDPLGVLRQLLESSPNCTRFALKFEGPTFLGATPERLIKKSGAFIETEALAGSSPLGEPAARALLASHKERTEHELVVREILHSLSPLSAELDHPREPIVRELRHLVHLQTPIRGRLHTPLHVLRLAERLHPTPAVGGVPTAQAVRWIREHEPHERGWYAGPIGWFDAAGDGELWVSLRSGVIDGTTAHLYAGGGIVRDSDPEREYDETRLKLRSLSSALRIAP